MPSRSVRGTRAPAWFVVVLIAGCASPGASPDTGTATSTASRSVAPSVATETPSAAAATPRVTARPNPMASPVVDARFAVASDGRKLKMTCWGEGSPTILLESGHPIGGIEQFERNGADFTKLLANERRVCAYDRAGYGSSDPAPNEPRDLDDVTDDLRALLAAADVDGPYVLAGASFGGFIVTYYTHRFPDGVRGVVLIDVPAPSATMTLAQEPPLAWNSPENPEHVDVIPEFENRLAKEQFPFEAPLLVITATRGQSNVADQAFWLEWSTSSRQIELAGEHSVYWQQPRAVADAILGMGD